MATFQTAVNKVAAATYMGGRTHGMDAILTAESPQLLIDRLSVQRVMAHQMSTQMARFKAAGEQAVKAEQAAAKSAADARSAAEQAAAVRANLQHKQSQLQVQIAVVKSQYVALTPEERTALADPGPVPAVAAIAPGPHLRRCRPVRRLATARRLAWRRRLVGCPDCLSCSPTALAATVRPLSKRR